MAPVLPGLSDRPEQLSEVVRAARDAGATHLGERRSTCDPGRASTSSSSLARDWPEELDRYERLYDRRAYLSAEHAKPLRAAVRELAKEHGVRDRRRVRPDPEPPVIAKQLALAL